MLRDVCDGLSVGSALDSRRESEDYDRIVSVAAVGDYTTDSYPLQHGDHDYETFENAVETVRDALESGDTVLVHCQAGMSRSVSVSATCLALHSECPLSEAVDIAQVGFVGPSPQLIQSAESYLRSERGWVEHPSEESE